MRNGNGDFVKMDDLVMRLRRAGFPNYSAVDMCKEGADEIERLRAALRDEREACAKVATGVHDHADCGHGEGYMNGRSDAAAAIRAQS